MQAKEYNLKQKTISSLFSSYFMQFANEAVQFITRIILAYLLSPTDFGLFALAFIVLNIAKTVIQLGLGQHVIREKMDNYATLFTIELVMGILVFLTIQIISPLLYRYNTALPAATKILSFAIIPYCFSIVPITYAQKELRLKQMIVPNLLFSFSFTIASILLALNKLGIWSLIYGHIISEIVLCYLAWRAFGGLIILNFKFKIKDIFKLVWQGKYFFALALFNIFSSSADRIILGKAISLKEIGYYSIALTLSLYPVNLIETALNNVFYPLFSKIRNDMTKTKEFYESTTLILYWIEIPLYIFLFFNADIIIKIIFGQKWLSAIPLFRLLCILPILTPCSTFGYQIMSAHKKENFLLYWSLCHFFLFVFIGWQNVTKLGVVGIIYTHFFLYPLNLVFLYAVNRITGNVLKIYVELLPIYMICLLIFIPLHFLVKERILMFSLSIACMILFCWIYYKINIHAIIKRKFGDITLFKNSKVI